MTDKSEPFHEQGPIISDQKLPMSLAENKPYRSILEIMKERNWKPIPYYILQAQKSARRRSANFHPIQLA